MQRYLTWVVFILLTGATIAIAAKAIRADLFAPPPFGQAELKAWLVSPNPDAAAAVRRRAARQLDRDFHAGFDWQPIVDELPADQRATFVANFQALLIVLLEQRADALRVQPSHRREQFLDRQLQEMSEWYVVGAKGKLNGPNLLRQGLIGLIGGAMQAGGSPKVHEFITALQSHLLKRSLERVFPGDPNPKR